MSTEVAYELPEYYYVYDPRLLWEDGYQWQAEIWYSAKDSCWHIQEKECKLNTYSI